MTRYQAGRPSAEAPSLPPDRRIGASGLPVIATRHAGIKDVVLEGKTGLLVDEGDVDGMAEHMIRLVKNPQLAGQLGQTARKRIEAEFSMEKSIAGLWSVIEGVIQNAT